MDDEPGHPSLVGSWRVERVGGAAVVAGAEPAIEFTDDGATVGTTGLNRFRGRYEVLAGELHCSPLATTRTAGPPDVMDQEHRFERALADPGPIRHEGTVVTIGDGAGELRLVRVDGDDSPATP